MRLVHALPALLVAPLLSLGTAAASPSTDVVQAREQAVRVSLETSTPWVKKRGTAYLNGRVRGVRGATTVTILQRLSGNRGWNVEATKRTSRKGYFKHHESIKSGTRDYKACVRGRCSKAVRVRMGTPPSRPTSISLGSLSASSVEAGQAFTVQGTATGLDGYSLAVQAYDPASAKWGTVGNVAVNGGAWMGTVAVSAAGKAVPIRATFPGATGRKPSTSNSAAIAVYGWYYLADRDMVDSLRFESGDTRIGGVPFSRAVYNSTDFWWASRPWGEWNLSYSCRTFDAHIGLDDASESGFKVGFRSWADSIERDHGIKTTGQTATRVTFDVSGVFRLRLQDEYVEGATGSGGGHGWGAWGDARVLCAF